MRRQTLPILALLTWVTACGGKSPPPAGAPIPATGAPSATTTASSTPASARNPDIITEEEAATAARAGVGNAFDLIRRLRPNFLRVNERTSMRGNPTAPLVRLNGQVLGEVTELRGIEIGVVQQIRYYSIVQAENTFAGDRGRPVIAVTTRKLTRPDAERSVSFTQTPTRRP